MENNDYIKKKKDELTENIKSSEQELKELREMCKHSNVIIRNVNPENGAADLRKVCTVCEKTLGFPTTQELQDNGYM